MYGMRTAIGAAVGVGYNLASSDSSFSGAVLAGALGAAAGRYGTVGAGRAYRSFNRSTRLGMSMGGAFGKAVMSGGTRSGALIGMDLTRSFNGFRGLANKAMRSPVATEVGSAISSSRKSGFAGGWKDPNSAGSVLSQKRIRDAASLGAGAERSMQAAIPNIVKSARRGAAAFKAEGEIPALGSLAGRAAGIPNRFGTVKQGDSLISLAARDMRR